MCSVVYVSVCRDWSQSGGEADSHGRTWILDAADVVILRPEGRLTKVILY